MWRDAAYLLDMLIAAKQAREFSQGLTWEQFQESSLHQLEPLLPPEDSLP